MKSFKIIIHFCLLAFCVYALFEKHWSVFIWISAIVAGGIWLFWLIKICQPKGHQNESYF
jgi:hypothetical protein